MHSPPLQPRASRTSGTGSVTTMWLEVTVSRWRSGRCPASAGPAANTTERQEITLQQGIPTEAAKEVVKFLKESKLRKVQASIQGDQLRVTSPSRDELQEVMRLLRERDFGVALQFGNYRG